MTAYTLAALVFVAAASQFLVVPGAAAVPPPNVSTIAQGTSQGSVSIASSPISPALSVGTGPPPPTPPGSWEPKDYALVIGALVTFVLGLWNLGVSHRLTRRATFVSTVTSQRILWIEQLRQDISSFSGLVYHCCFTSLSDESERRTIIKEIDRLRHVIRLRINPTGVPDREIERLLIEIPRHTSDQAKIEALLEELTRNTQYLLKEEWEKVKLESKNGPLSERA